jgi:hypothetical protein
LTHGRSFITHRNSFVTDGSFYPIGGRQQNRPSRHLATRVLQKGGYSHQSKVQFVFGKFSFKSEVKAYLNRLFAKPQNVTRDFSQNLTKNNNLFKISDGYKFQPSVAK